MKQFYLYIAYKKNTFDSIGVTNSLKRRFKLLNQLKDANVKLVYFEEYKDSQEASIRESYLQSLQTSLLVELVVANNPMLTNLLDEV